MRLCWLVIFVPVFGASACGQRTAPSVLPSPVTSSQYDFAGYRSVETFNPGGSVATVNTTFTQQVSVTSGHIFFGTPNVDDVQVLENDSGVPGTPIAIELGRALDAHGNLLEYGDLYDNGPSGQTHVDVRKEPALLQKHSDSAPDSWGIVGARHVEDPGEVWGAVADYAQDGSYTRVIRFNGPQGPQQDAGDSITFTARSDGSGTITVTRPDRVQTYDVARPQGGVINITETETPSGAVLKRSIPTWFGTPTSIATSSYDTIEFDGSVNLPSTCNVGPSVPRTVAKFERFTQFFDALLGVMSMTQTDVYTNASIGVVCQNTTQTVYTYYDVTKIAEGDATFSGTPLSRTQTRASTALQDFRLSPAQRHILDFGVLIFPEQTGGPYEAPH
jgi:hypothetical protein